MCQVQFISSSGLIRRNKPKQEGLMGPAANPETASSAHLSPKHSPCQGFQFSSAGGEMELFMPAHAGEESSQKVIVRC